MYVGYGCSLLHWLDLQSIPALSFSLLLACGNCSMAGRVSRSEKITVVRSSNVVRTLVRSSLHHRTAP